MTAVPLQNTPEWVAWRRGGIGASEIPAILGDDPYRSEYELALLKRGDMAPEPSNPAMEWGHRVQRMALAAHAEESGLRIRNVRTTLTSKRYPHVYASLDGRVVGERRGIEVKLTRVWEEPPRRVVIQCQVQMAVADLESVDVVRVGMGYQAPAVYRILRDDQLIDELLPLAEAWFVRYVVGDELPPIDGSRGASRHLDRISGPPEMVASADQAALAALLHQLKATVKTTEAEHDLVINRLKESMAGAETLTGSGFRVAWRRQKPRQTVDWRALAAHYRSMSDAPPDALDEIEQRHTSASEGARPFRVSWKDEETS